jgi:YggT family protein
MAFFLYIIYQLLSLYVIVLIASVILSWLIAFNVVNTQNRIVYVIGDFLHRATEPVLRPIRRFLPDLGGIDISPLIVLIIIWAAQVQIQKWLIAL